MNQKIVEGKGCFSSKYNIDTTTGCIGNCSYGYCRIFQKKGPVKVKTCNTKVLDRQWKKLNTSHNVIRIGKFTDPGFETDEYTKLINWMHSNNIKPVTVTKMPHASLSIHEKIKEVKGVYQITIGYDDMEKGMCDAGFDNEFRKCAGDILINKGYNVIFRLVREITKEPDSWTFNFIKNYKEKILLTPLRFRNKNIITQLGGDPKGYNYYENYYRPFDIHPYYIQVKGCLDNLNTTYCGKCFLEEI